MASMASSEDSPSSSRSSKPLSKLAESLTFSSRSGNHEPTVSRERSSDALARSQRRFGGGVLCFALFEMGRDRGGQEPEGWGFVQEGGGENAKIGVGGRGRDHSAKCED